ncbi:MAG: PIG-L family deacetylase [Alphaproteobacteria bacterium]|nr:PIG-L family deacetylase [Alphaproteobacteria bacterium]
MHHLVSLTRRVEEIFEQERPAAVITHAYEGGHPDHDASAFAVHAACALMPALPTTLEMALYHRRDGHLVSGEFLPSAPRRKPGRTPPSLERLNNGSRLPPGPELNPVDLELNREELRRKQQMIDSFATQRWLLMQLDWTTERLRIAPDYDFGAPPHPGELHYETLGWDIAGAGWRRRAVAALDEFGCR